MSGLEKFLRSQLQKREDEGLFRKLTHNSFLTDFSSNDYLGLANSKQLHDLISQKLESLPVKKNGATGSRLLSGNEEYYELVEQKLAKVFNAESSLIFNSGYAANQAVLSSIPKKGDTIFFDELAHACIKDGARLSLANRYAFRHNDLNDLEKKIQRTTSNRIYIAVESIYSMDGDQTPLLELVTLAKRYDASIILDEAHSTGVFGKCGSGLAAELNLSDDIDIRIHTFGKAMGVHGASVSGSKNLTSYLINFARPFIYTTALPMHSITSIECSFDYLSANQSLQTSLKYVIANFLNSAGKLQSTKSKSAIQTMIIPGNSQVRDAAIYLQSLGLDVRPILSPTVQKGSERLRICLHTFNTDEDVKALTSALQKVNVN
jgi:8-amino-7-oxononanoate synthase